MNATRSLRPVVRALILAVLAGSLVLSACAPTPAAGNATPARGAGATGPAGAPQVLRLATTTSTQDSGLLDALLPVFEKQYNARVDVVAVGTGQALALGQKGDADVVLVHARAREDAFVAAGDGVNRQDVMYNDFILVGPAADPAKIAGAASAAGALKAIAAAGAPFASRGDDSGTYTKEQSLWARTGVTPSTASGWYFSLGQGMGETLNFANERRAYTLSDRATFLAQQSRLPELAILFGGTTIEANPDQELYNPYGVIAVNPEKHPGVNGALAGQFIEWLVSLPAQELIDAYGRDRFGQALFRPSSAAWRAAHP